MKIHPGYLRWLLYATLACFGILMLRITARYLTFDTRTAFLAIKRSMTGNLFWLVSFYTHVLTSCLLLAAGFTQFSGEILGKRRKFHRFAGKIYVIVLLFFSGPSGFVMALYANGGIWSRIGFTLLAALWMFTTLLAWRQAVRKDFEGHREWMIRSFALTVSALTLRLWKLLIVLALAPPPMDVYRAVAWLGWIPNLLLAEWIILRRRNKDPYTVRIKR